MSNKSEQHSPTTPDWPYWKGIPTVEFWQGVLLSMNIEPGPGIVINNKPPQARGVAYAALDSLENIAEFDRRLYQLINMHETYLARTGRPQKMGVDSFITHNVLCELATFLEWPHLPCEFTSLSAKPTETKQQVKNRKDSLRRAIFDAWNSGLSVDSSAGDLIDYLCDNDSTYILGKTAEGIKWMNSTGEASETSTKKLGERITKYRNAWRNGERS